MTRPSTSKDLKIILPPADQLGRQNRLRQSTSPTAPVEASKAGAVQNVDDSAPHQLGPQDQLCRTAGAAALSGGSEAHEVGSVGAIFQWPIRVYWEDTDAGGIVFYANYLKFFERSRTEWLRSLGIGQRALKNSTGCMFVVAEAALRYHRPARLDDELIVTASLLEAGRASMIIKQQALLKTEQPDAGSATLLCEGSIRIGWVEGASLQPRRIPASIFDRLNNRETKAST